ncbi:hypothetical protein SAMN05444695_10999 [Rhodococcus triatomae]|uniref:PH domain-containing protein n=2 Tax=Rhodococcus triatomae TaxID=300028 RepID=A0A1G8M486_9NOCA|nr:hypothetical protein SAMN05444695_10999 [Rhodococcus triatomae]
MQSSEATRPAEWPSGNWRTLRERIKLALAAVFGAVVMFVCAAGVVVMLDEGSPQSAKYFVLFGLLWVPILAFPLVYKPKANGRLAPTERTLNGSPATTIEYSSGPLTVMSILTGFVSLMMGLGAYDYSLEAESDGYGSTVIFAAIALFFGSFPLSYLLGRLRRGYIAFTTEGIHQRGWAFESFLPWDSVMGVSAGYQGFPMTLIIAYNDEGWRRRYTARLWRIDRIPPTPMMDIDYRKIGDDAALVHAFIVEQVERNRRPLRR